MQNIRVAKRRSSPTTLRGRPHRPHSVAATQQNRVGQRVLALKVEIDWKREESRGLYSRLRDLGWMAAHYRNQVSHTKWAEARGWKVEIDWRGTKGKVDPAAQHKHDAAKQIRQTEKGELSGDAYSCAEQEVEGAWTRDGKRILAGQPVPQWKPGAALSISGKEKKQDSGIRLHLESGQYILYLRAQSEHSPAASFTVAPKDVRARGNGWLRLPIAKHTKRDEWQGPILNRMVSWETPIKKATVHVEPHGITARLTHKIQLPPLLPMGARIATFGPVGSDGQLRLRTETQTKDYASKLIYIAGLKDQWDLIRRRAKAQIGWRKGQARLKREAIARFALPDKELSCLHMWTREIVDWCESQGIGAIRVVEIANGDWPADRFTALLKYKADERGIRVEEGADVQADSSARAARAVLGKRQRRVKQRTEAVRTIRHCLSETNKDEEK